MLQIKRNAYYVSDQESIDEEAEVAAIMGDDALTPSGASSDSEAGASFLSPRSKVKKKRKHKKSAKMNEKRVNVSGTTYGNFDQ